MENIQNEKDLGIILLKMQSSPTIDRLLQNMSSFAKKRPYNQTVLFNSYANVINNYKLPILHISQAKFFDGNIVTMDLASLYLSTKFIKPIKIFFYATYIPWIELKKPYFYWKYLFENSKIEIIAANKQISDIYEIMWKKPVCTTEEFNYEQLQHIL